MIFVVAQLRNVDMDLHSFRVFAVASSTGTGMFQTKRVVRARYDIPTVLYDKSAMTKKRDDRTSHSYRLSLSCPVSVTILSCYFRSLAPAVLCNRFRASPPSATLKACVYRGWLLICHPNESNPSPQSVIVCRHNLNADHSISATTPPTHSFASVFVAQQVET